MQTRREAQGATLVLTLDRRPVNAVDLPAVETLEAVFREIAAAPPAGGLVLTGAGAAFSAGVDTKAYADYDSAARGALFVAITRMVAVLYALPCPVVAAINGHALGGGFVLALACDQRLAADNDTIKLGLTEARAGVPFPAGALEIIKAELPAPLLRRMVLTSATYSPHTLCHEGVIDALCAREGVIEAAIETAAEMARQPAFVAVKAQVKAETIARLEVQRQKPRPSR